MTDSIPATTKRTILRSQVTGKWLETPPSYDTSMGIASLKWYSEMHGIFDKYCCTPPNLLTHCEGLRSSILHRSWMSQSSNAMTKSSLDASRPLQSKQCELGSPICSPQRTTNLPRSYVAQLMLKKLKECLHQQMNCLLRISGNSQRIACWTCSISRILMHYSEAVSPSPPI